MRVAALAVGEEGEEEEDEDEEEEAEDRTGHRHEVRGLAMCPAATAAVGGRSRQPATMCPIFFVLLLLLPVWILTIVVDASPLHPVPPHRGESRLPFFVDSLEERCPKVRVHFG